MRIEWVIAMGTSISYVCTQAAIGWQSWPHTVSQWGWKKKPTITPAVFLRSRPVSCTQRGDLLRYCVHCDWLNEQSVFESTDGFTSRCALQRDSISNRCNEHLTNLVFLVRALRGHTVAMVSYCVKKMMTTCSLMIGQFFDNKIVASSDRVVITTHPNISAGNCIEPPYSGYHIAALTIVFLLSFWYLLLRFWRLRLSWHLV